ncbi:MAG: MBL fold metallo-hydrolase [Lachnospiraceae bacterium]|nr:MBL fold metallo-hydrolase [Lachnospiraceae bacterium]
MTKVTYIGHSGFFVEMEKCQLLFDYYQGELPEINDKKPLYVFVSHKHADHFNKAVFSLARRHPQITFVLSKDTHMNEKYMKRVGVPEEAWDKILYVKPDEQYNPGEGICASTFHIRTLRSTDEGVAFLVKTEEGTIYHAGDLNWWHWEGETEEYNRQMAKDYQNEILKLREETIDIAFVPLDPRLQDAYWYGMDYFLRNVACRWAFPMHFWGKYEIIQKFKCREGAKAYKDKVSEIQREGQSFALK